MADVVKNIENYFAELNVIVDEVKALNHKLLTLKATVAGLPYQATETEACNEEESMFDDPRYNYWYDWRNEYDKKNFAGFAEWMMSKNLKCGKRYGFAIGPTAIFGDKLQVVVILFECGEDEYYCDCEVPAGMMVDEYIIGSEEYKKMAVRVYAPLHEMLIEVNLDEIPQTFGTICLKESDGKLHMDWDTFEPNQTIGTRSEEFSELMVERMEQKNCA